MHTDLKARPLRRTSTTRCATQPGRQQRAQAVNHQQVDGLGQLYVSIAEYCQKQWAFPDRCAILREAISRLSHDRYQQSPTLLRSAASHAITHSSRSSSNANTSYTRARCSPSSGCCSAVGIAAANIVSKRYNVMALLVSTYSTRSPRRSVSQAAVRQSCVLPLAAPPKTSMR